VRLLVFCKEICYDAPSDERKKVYIYIFIYLFKCLIYRLCCYVVFKWHFVRGPLTKATYQAGRVQASARRARHKFQIYFYIGHFLLCSPFVIYRLWQTGSVSAQLNRQPSFPTPKRENRSVFPHVIFEETGKWWALANTLMDLP